MSESKLLPKLQPNDVNVVIYHSPCTDGYGSRLCAERYLSKFPDRKVEYYPANIDDLPPEGLENKNVLICDYSYKKEVLKELLTKVNQLLIIDHHESAQKELAEIDDQYKIFSMKHSGAMLTWMYFYPNQKPPLLIEYIQDRDIWTKALPYTDDFTAWFYTLPYDYKVYSSYLDDELLMQMIKSKGVGYNELNNIHINKSLEYANIKFCKIKDAYYFVAYINTTLYKSDIGNQLCLKNPFIDFSAVYSISDVNDCTHFSLRSTNKQINVSELSTKLGGGGHRNASGVKVDYITNKLGKVIDSGNLYPLLNNVYYGTYKDYNVVYLQSSSNQYELGKYLLQIKYGNVQVCQEIIMKLYQQDIKDFKIACVWTYIPMDDKSYYVIVKNDLNIDLNDEMFFDGLCKEIKMI